MNHFARVSTCHMGLSSSTLFRNYPDSHCFFFLGKFSLPLTARPGSRVGIDHAHEQNNGNVKASGGAVGLTNDPAALRRWTVARLEVCLLLDQFKEKESNHDKQDTHHEQYEAFQIKFLKQCLAAKESFLEFQNPFELESSDLLVLDSRIVASKECSDFLGRIDSLGATAFEKYVRDRLINCTKSVHDPIKKTSLHLLSEKQTKKVSRADGMIDTLSKNNQLFTRLFAVSSSRKLDMDIFFL